MSAARSASHIRWHFDVWLAAEVAGERIAAALARGGSIGAAP